MKPETETYRKLLSMDIGDTPCTWTGGSEPCEGCPRKITALHMCKLLQDVEKHISEEIKHEKKTLTPKKRKTMKIQQAIQRAKNKLRKQPICENFGDKEIRKIEASYIDGSDYSPEMNENRRALNNFVEWCYNYDS